MHSAADGLRMVPGLKDMSSPRLYDGSVTLGPGLRRPTYRGRCIHPRRTTGRVSIRSPSQREV
ncbi:hypothetical protein BLAT2472_10576 [Burkholderia latens]